MEIIEYQIEKSLVSSSSLGALNGCRITAYEKRKREATCERPHIRCSAS
jgi:hypothetical protein